MTKFSQLEFRQVARGFILSTPSGVSIPVEYAFDDIQDLADWLVEVYKDKTPIMTTFKGKPISELTDEERQESRDYMRRKLEQ